MKKTKLFTYIPHNFFSTYDYNSLSPGIEPLICTYYKRKTRIDKTLYKELTKEMIEKCKKYGEEK